MTSYSDLLKDPRWQKRRLQIMQRDDFKCQLCGDDKKTLNVHHLHYKGMPWEALDKHLITLCESCHRIEEGVEVNVLKVLKHVNEFGCLQMDMMNLLMSAVDRAERLKIDTRKCVLQSIELLKNG